MNPLRIAVVGAGAIAQRNAIEAAASGAASIVGVFDVNTKVARDMAKRLGAQVFSSYQQLLDTREVEAVLMSTPHHVHKSMTVAAAAKGKHVLVEKPLATTMADADEMIAACKAAGVALAVNYSFRYLPKIQKARELVQAGAVGDVTGVQIIAHQFKDPGYWMGARSNSPDDWRSSREKCGGGFLIMNVCHTIDYLYYITGLRGTRVYCEYENASSPGDVEDILSLTCRWGDKAVGSISASSIMRGSDSSEERVVGHQGHARAERRGPDRLLHPPNRRHETRSCARVPQVPGRELDGRMGTAVRRGRARGQGAGSRRPGGLGEPGIHHIGVPIPRSRRAGTIPAYAEAGVPCRS